MTGQVVVTDQTFGNVARERALAERLGLSFADHQCRTEAETVAAVSGAQIVFVNFAPITRKVLAALAPGALVIRYGIGFDNVDTQAARELGVRVSNIPDYGVATVADHTVALLLTLLRRVTAFDQAVQARGWLNAGDLGSLRGFAETTVGLVGSGRIGRAVIDRLKPFGFRVIVHDPYVQSAELSALGAESVELDDLLAHSHAISLHVPLTDSTHHLLDKRALQRVQPEAVIVNTARGGLIDERELVASLASGRLRAAALDVVEDEPLPLDSPLRDAPNLILTPHAAFFSDESLDALQRMATEEAERALTGGTLRSQVV
jgi:D-3-phosphoglycerate dehydrogenase